MDTRKPIPYFPRYEVTNTGKVFTTRGTNIFPHLSNGYNRVSLIRDDGKRIGVDVHRLVYAAFIDLIPKGMWVNHRDGDKLNNHVSNLELTEPHWKNKPSIVKTNILRHQAIEALIALGWSQYQIAEALNCSQSNISQILSSPPIESVV